MDTSVLSSERMLQDAYVCNRWTWDWKYGHELIEGARHQDRPTGRQLQSDLVEAVPMLLYGSHYTNPTIQEQTWTQAAEMEFLGTVAGYGKTISETKESDSN
jgi:hypothetical protein